MNSLEFERWIGYKAWGFFTVSVIKSQYVICQSPLNDPSLSYNCCCLNPEINRRNLESWMPTCHHVGRFALLVQVCLFFNISCMSEPTQVLTQKAESSREAGSQTALWNQVFGSSRICRWNKAWLRITQASPHEAAGLLIVSCLDVPVNMKSRESNRVTSVKVTKPYWVPSMWWGGTEEHLGNFRHVRTQTPPDVHRFMSDS